MPAFEDALSTALRQAAESAEPDRPLRLVSAAHAQGRRTRRRRKAAVVSVTAAVAAAAAVGGTLVATSGSDGHRIDTMVASPPTPLSGSAARDARMHQALTTLLTPGTLTGIRPEDSAAKDDTAQHLAPAAGIAAKFTNTRGTAVVSIVVTRKPAGSGPSTAVCPPVRGGESDGPCHLSLYKDGRLIVSQSMHPAPEDWLASTYETPDYQVTVNQQWIRNPGTNNATPQTDAPLSTQQLTSIAESDQWRHIATTMPPPPASATIPFRLIPTTPWA